MHPLMILGALAGIGGTGIAAYRLYSEGKLPRLSLPARNVTPRKSPRATAGAPQGGGVQAAMAQLRTVSGIGEGPDYSSLLRPIEVRPNFVEPPARPTFDRLIAEM